MALPSNFPDGSVCIIGLGYVGLTLSVAMANAGFRVHGIERNPDTLKCVRAGRAHFTEVGLDEKLARQVQARQIVVSDKLEPGMPTTTYIVTVGTPLGHGKKTDYAAIEQVANDLSKVLKDGDLVMLRSTVRVGTTRNIVKPILDKSGATYDLTFCPERTLEGRALAELRTLPQIIGGINHRSALRASQLYTFLTPSVIRVNDLETAEMIKLINNTQRDYIFAFANEVASMCDAVGVSASEVIAAGNLGYERSNLPLPGPVGGPCLEKDPHILAEGIEPYGFTPELSLAARVWNETLPDRTIAQIAGLWKDKVGADNAPGTITILGLAFKGRPETDDLRGTMAGPIIKSLRTHFPGAKLKAFDPVVAMDKAADFGVEPCPTLEDAMRGASIAVIQNNHNAFSRMPLARLATTMQQPGIIYDYWNQLHGEDLDLPSGVAYCGLGNLVNLNSWPTGHDNDKQAV
ncbi:nucleotide sugar dehydrogenase [Kordiimonas marina]|uniref:nucleotide sugar dehydrogenase n=1 Tax=Kordiimonas marina TaxID=2872312 RepID=UPI001FF6C3AF|nr:nucleotide sugar dehydrogenase [Kordiimonas marina]MCJ9429965.1 nucleotide sugar dehydrogenase [Kordiimonas marina]